MFAGITLLLTLFTMESPRHLVRAGKREEALKTLCKFRGLPADHPYVLDEITAIDVSFQEEKEATLGMGWKGVLKEIFLVKRNSYRLFLTNLAQIMACWSGGSAITVVSCKNLQCVDGSELTTGNYSTPLTCLSSLASLARSSLSSRL